MKRLAFLATVLLMGFLLWLAVTGCQDSPNAPDETAQDSTISEPEKTTQEPTGYVQYESVEAIQYSNELPATGGVKIW